MKNLYKVYWTVESQSDIRIIINYIAIDNPSIAKAVMQKIKEMGNNLKQFPQRGRKVPELLQNNIDYYHEIMHSPWRIIYKNESNNVFILAVFDGRRNLEDILLERILSRN
jgi:plasmid stabilization system protein ParE